MTQIDITTQVNAPKAMVFDCSRDIGFHATSASQTKEKAIAGITNGLIKKGESVTWRGKHFGLFLKHTSKILEMTHYDSFTDVMTKGHFTYFVHQHLFNENAQGVLMIDKLQYKVPYGWIGRLFDSIILKKHLTQFLKHRNQQIKEYCEHLN